MNDRPWPDILSFGSQWQASRLVVGCHDFNAGSNWTLTTGCLFNAVWQLYLFPNIVPNTPALNWSSTFYGRANNSRDTICNCPFLEQLEYPCFWLIRWQIQTCIPLESHVLRVSGVRVYFVRPISLAEIRSYSQFWCDLALSLFSCNHNILLQ